MFVQLTSSAPAEGAANVTSDHFGVNVVTIYDQEFADPNTALNDFVASMSVSNLRFPGGSATENYFDMTDPNAEWSARKAETQLTPMDDFFVAAGKNNFDVTLVLPTQVGFAQTAGQAMKSGQYGDRTQLDSSYMSDLITFIETALAEAAQNNVQITALEIGNEFWGSGEMTASEYGFIAGKVAKAVEDYLDSVNMSDISIVAQTTSSASQLYSPRNDTMAYVDQNNEVYTQSFMDNTFGGNIPTGWTAVTVPGQGSATSQVSAIANGINATAGAADALDATVQHAYFDMGFDGVDGGRAFMFGQWERLEDQLNRSADAPDLGRYLTEWNTDSRGAENNRGLEQASMMMEIFHEFTQHGVTDAHVWPLTFNAAQSTSLVDLKDGHLAIAGEMYKLMAETLPGTAPTIDFEVSGEIDVHVFESNKRDVVFVSERSGEGQQNVTVDFGDVVDAGNHFITVTELWDGGAGGAEENVKPVLSYMDGITNNGTDVTFDINSHANLRIEVTEVGVGHDTVTGYGGDDRIFTYGGRDTINAGAGDDTINAGWANDIIQAGDGDDTLIGSRGNDTLEGGAGKDLFIFGFKHGKDTVLDFTFGEDTIRIKGVDYKTLEELEASTAFDLSSDANGLKIVYGAEDIVTLQDVTYVPEPETVQGTGGRLEGGRVEDILIGSSQRDDIRGRNGDDTIVDGRGYDTMRGGDGNDTFILVLDGDLDRIADFTSGEDTLDISAWGASDISDLNIYVDYNANGTWMRRGFIEYEDERLRLDGLDDQTLAILSNADFLF